MRPRRVVAMLSAVFLAMVALYGMLGELITLPRLGGLVLLLAAIAIAGYRLGRDPRS